MTMPVDRERDRRSLKDLANMASMTPSPPSVSAPNSQSGVVRAGEAKGDDSGLIDLAAMTAAAEPSAPAVSAPAASSTPLATAGLFDDEPQSVRPGPISQVAQPVPTIPPMPASMAPASVAAPVSAAAAAPAVMAQASAKAPEQEKNKGGKLVAIVFGAVALAAAAAGTFVVMRGHQEKQAAATAMNEAPKPVAVATAKAPEPAPVAPAATEAPATEPTTDLSALPSADAKIAAKGAVRPAAKPGAPAAAAPAAAPKAEEPKLAAKDMPPPATGPVGALGDEMRKAVGSTGEAVPAAGPAGPSGPAAGTVPTKPSQGAVTGALGSVLPAARACLGPDDPISRASVVFGSNGTVQSVNVSGAAAGKPAEACIKSALMKAKVAPFAEATYSAPVTIRH